MGFLIALLLAFIPMPSATDNNAPRTGAQTAIKKNQSAARTNPHNKSLMDSVNAMEPYAKQHFRTRINDLLLLNKESEKQAEEARKAIITQIRQKALLIKNSVPSQILNMKMGDLEMRGGWVKIQEHNVEIYTPKRALYGPPMPKAPRDPRPDEVVDVQLVVKSKNGTPIKVDEYLQEETGQFVRKGLFKD